LNFFYRRTGKSRGYAFVEFDTRHDAENAYDYFQGYMLDGRRLRLDWDIGIDRKMQVRHRRGYYKNSRYK
jgi:RNA recognition motif-containing protein